MQKMAGLPKGFILDPFQVFYGFLSSAIQLPLSSSLFL